jgi:hypothetical protein
VTAHPVLFGILCFGLGIALQARPPLEMFMSGAAYLYILTNAWFVLALWPTPIARGPSWGARMEQVRRHMDLLAHGYVWERNDPPGSWSACPSCSSGRCARDGRAAM